MIILDTNVISETLRPSPYYNVINWLNEKDNDELYLSAIVWPNCSAASPACLTASASGISSSNWRTRLN